MPSKRIAIIDDNDDFCVLIAALLDSCYEVETFSDGISGLKLIRYSPPDALLLDIGLPELNGIAVLKLIRSDPTLRNLPVIAVTAYAMPSDQRAFREAGFDDVFAKPILDICALANRIGELIDIRTGNSICDTRAIPIASKPTGF